MYSKLEKIGDIWSNGYVHHEKELNMSDEFYKIGSIEDMKPVCSNCHATIHRKRSAYTIEEISRNIRE